jgi:DNA polymerase elongation subunit (family B)
VFGIKFFSVLDRGSQYRVESMLLRLSKPQNYLLLSVSPTQRSRQPAMECIPLVMEPVSAFYADPVIVLDFQSLYPSMVIAYNICYSTCLGKIPNTTPPSNDTTNQPPRASLNPTSQPTPPSQISQPRSDASQSQVDADPRTHQQLSRAPVMESGAASILSSSPELPTSTPDPYVDFGGSHLDRSLPLLGELVRSDSLFLSSNGIMFTRPTVKQGILPRMLSEILATRIMVKKSMNRAEVKAHRGLHRLLNARQFGLKLISNVTYGYTAAGFSGRMPCAEIADAIVQSGRDTLERAIRMVESDPIWRARVVYGDTDSMFVVLPGRTKEEAFIIGREIAARVTETNPRPVQLSMDKVYQPCTLLSKKRYIGWRWDSPKQQQGYLESKGVETARRDGCPALVKTMDSVMRILFTTRDLSQVRSFIERAWNRIWAGGRSLNVADLVFAKEVRLGNYKQPPLAAVLATRMMQQDPRARPLYAERVPYVIVDGPPAARLVDRLQHPLTLSLRPDLYRPCASYYIEVVINRPLMRVLDLMGVDIRAWFANWARPRRQALAPPMEMSEGRRKGKLTDMTDAPNSTIPSTNTSTGRYTRSARNPRTSGSFRPNNLGLGSSHASGSSAALSGRHTIDQYYASQHCLICDGITQAQRPFCETCMERGVIGTISNTGSGTNLARGAWVRLEWFSRLALAEQKLQLSLSTCANCVSDGLRHGIGGGESSVRGSLLIASSVSVSLSHSAPHQLVPCISMDCPNQFIRQSRAYNTLQLRTIARELAIE